MDAATLAAAAQLNEQVVAALDAMADRDDFWVNGVRMSCGLDEDERPGWIGNIPGPGSFVHIRRRCDDWGLTCSTAEGSATTEHALASQAIRELVFFLDCQGVG